MSHSVHGTFVSEKINKIRWRPDEFNNSQFFITGSVDNDCNNIKLWDFHENEEEDDIYPFLISTFPYCGDITEIQFLNADYFVTSSSSGSAHLMKIIPSYTENVALKNEIEWKEIHGFKNGDTSPCTSLAVYENDIVTVGEDGRINLLNAKAQRVHGKIEDADSCSIQCVIFLKHNEILTSNLRGQLKIWDLRSSSNDPNSTFMISGDQVTPTCLTYHPTQRHLIITGDDLGALTTWDLRHNTYPVNVLNAHDGAISEIQFDPEHPDQLFSCSSAGEIWHWATKSDSRLALLTDTIETNVWLAPDNVKNKLEVFTLMPTLGKPINSLDLNRKKVICGCDNEAIYLINGMASIGSDANDQSDCKYCKKVVANGVKCINCDSNYHPSCGQRINAKIIYCDNKKLPQSCDDVETNSTGTYNEILTYLKRLESDLKLEKSKNADLEIQYKAAIQTNVDTNKVDSRKNWSVTNQQNLINNNVNKDKKGVMAVATQPSTMMQSTQG
ncbi:hypothetical protein JTB14_025097 [Gonioctena quinquepunctata]|nr:hypothetical protein JTB14_025097 [Gonioctena quinquepunctata]